MPGSKKIAPRNPTATDPLLKKGHAHRSKKDYDRRLEKQKLKHELHEGGRKHED